LEKLLILLGKTSISSWLNFYLLAKFYLLTKKLYIFELNQKTIFLTKSFNKKFGYPIDLAIY
jgi:hypothetical protein